MRDLARSVTKFACEVAIYACERILETLAAEQPLHDQPLPGGHTDVWPDDMLPDELWPPPRRPTLIFDGPDSTDRSGLIRGEILRRAAVQWRGIPYGDPERN